VYVTSSTRFIQAYYVPNAKRPNLHVLVNALVTKVATRPDANGLLIATGAEFLHSGKRYLAQAKREVILCAGCVLVSSYFQTRRSCYTS
jgi:choline dehydrogenase-like flavoprotein